MENGTSQWRNFKKKKEKCDAEQDKSTSKKKIILWTKDFHDYVFSFFVIKSLNFDINFQISLRLFKHPFIFLFFYGEFVLRPISCAQKHLGQKCLWGPGWCGSVDWAWPADQRVSSSIPSQGTCLGCKPGSQCGAWERQPHIDVSLPLFLLPFPSLKINKQIDL